MDILRDNEFRFNLTSIHNRLLVDIHIFIHVHMDGGILWRVLTSSLIKLLIRVVTRTTDEWNRRLSTVKQQVGEVVLFLECEV